MFDMQGRGDGSAYGDLRLRRHHHRTKRRPKVCWVPLHREYLAVAGLPVARFDFGGVTVLSADHPLSYYNFRDALSQDILSGVVGQSVDQLMARSKACSGVDAAQAAEWLERFLADIRRELARR